MAIPEVREAKEERCRKWAEDNRDRRRLSQIEWRKDNKDKVQDYKLRRRSQKVQATPAWSDKSEILYVYSLAKEKGLVVDHMVPLNSELVCGLHTPDNLRCIPMKLNSHKGNRYWPQM